MAEDPDILVPLTTARSEFEAETIAESLRAQGIPAQVFGVAARMGQWEFGITNDVKVMVRRADLDRAGQALRAIKADSVDIDWDEVDVGAPARERGAEPVPAREADRRRHVVALITIGVLLLGAIIVLRWLAPGLLGGGTSAP